MQRNRLSLKLLTLLKLSPRPLSWSTLVVTTSTHEQKCFVIFACRYNMNNKNLFFFFFFRKLIPTWTCPRRLPPYILLFHLICSVWIVMMSTRNYLPVLHDWLTEWYSMLWIRTGTKIEGMNFIQFPFTLPIQIRAAFQAGVSSTSCQFSGLCTGLLSRKICYFHAFFL